MGRLRSWAVPLAGALFLGLLALGRLRDPSPSETPPLESADPIERLRAVQGLATARDPQAASLLVRRLTDPDERVAVAAAEELARLRDRSAVAGVLALYPSRPAAIALAGLADEEEVAVVYDMFHSSDPVIRRCGTEALGRLCGEDYKKRGVPIYDTVLRERLADADEMVRITAARQVRKNVPQADALKLMAWAIGHENATVRRTAAIELSGYGSAAGPTLEEHRDDPDEGVKIAVNASLKRVGSSR